MSLSALQRGNRLRLCQGRTRRRDMQVLDDPPVDHRHALPFALCLLEGGDLALGQRHLVLGRREGGVGDVDLRGMDQGLAVEPQVPALFAFGAQAGLVLECVVDAVDADDALRARRQQAELQAGEQRQAVGAEPAIEFLCQIVGAQHETGNAMMRGDLHRVHHAARRFDHRPDRQVDTQNIGKRLDVQRVVDLGQQDRVGARASECGGVGLAPLGVQPVDPHDLGPLSEAALLQSMYLIPAIKRKHPMHWRIFRPQSI